MATPTSRHPTQPAHEPDTDLVTTFRLRDVEAQCRVRLHLLGQYGVTVFHDEEEFRVAVGHRVEDLGHIVQLVRQIEPYAVVRSCIRAP